ncbi:MAG TPA: hypothetical protein VFP65_11260 [Anaeromyxobacteraceae bacterium]|nr:hypothetical protein [Anaeromyxobacteraceae bacterium]
MTLIDPKTGGPYVPAPRYSPPVQPPHLRRVYDCDWLGDYAIGTLLNGTGGPVPTTPTAPRRHGQ